jgi:predicted  nucleic acid-binding Zn-ribbon protein
MNLAKQLYQLQEVDLEIETCEQTIKQIKGQLGESETVIIARQKLAAEEQHLEELLKQQRSIEWEIDDINTKLKKEEEELYSGRIRNPKELENLQHETEIMKTKRSRLEDNALEIMDQVELATRNVNNFKSGLTTLEKEWQNQQKDLSANLKQNEILLADLRQKWQTMAGDIDSKSIGVYQQIKKQKGTAVARVEQGICRGCRISLPVSELQKTKSGNLIQCSNCGRIMFLA